MIERLALALHGLGVEPTFDDLRDVLWLAGHLSPAVPLPPQPEGEPPTPGVAGARAATEGAGAVAGRPPSPMPPSVATRRVVDEDAADATAVYGGIQGGASVAARRVSLPGVAPLPQAMEIARALRPLGRRRPFGPPVALDEIATAERIAETGLKLPVLVPRRERWFDIVLAVEDTPSFVAWKATVAQLQRLLERHGGFRAVGRVWLAQQGDAIAIRSAAGRPRPFASMLDRHGRRLVLVVSDCTSAAWHSGAMGDWLARLAAKAPLAVAQPLPAALWSHTALGFTEFSARADMPGAPTAKLRVARPRWAVGEPGAVVPVVALDPDAVRRWARMVMASGNAFAVAALVPSSPPSPAKASEAVTRAAAAGAASHHMASPLELLDAFRAAASADALRLAVFLSSVKPLTLPVMRLLHSSLLPESGIDALAQLLIGGIVVPASASSATTAEDNVVYEMDDTVRRELMTGLLRSDWLRVNLAVQRHVAERTGHGFDFFAYLEDRLGDERVDPAALPFAQFARSLADRFRAPGAMPGVAAGRSRSVEEPVFGVGLTVRAARRLSTRAHHLRWSADGRLAVLHEVGVDVFGNRELPLLAREREGPHRVEWLVHPGDRAVLAPLLALLENEAERQSGQPFRFDVVPFEGRLPRRDAARDERLDRGTASRLRLIALTGRFARPAGRSSKRDWATQVARALGSDDLHDWTPVPLDVAWADSAAERWTFGWARLFVDAADSEPTRAAVATLVERARSDRGAEEGGKILAAAWDAGSGSDLAASELYSLRQASGAGEIVDAVCGVPGQTPRWLGTPRGSRAGIVDFDVTGSLLAIAYAAGEIFAWSAGADRRGTIVYGGERGLARAVRWSPRGAVVAWVDGAGLQKQPVEFDAPGVAS